MTNPAEYPEVQNDRAQAPRADAQGVDEPPAPNIRDFLAMLYRHRWSALFVFTVVLATGVLFTVRRTPIYESTPALLEITSDNAGVATVRDVFERQMVSMQHFETQINLAKSEGILRAAYDKLPAIAAKMTFPEFQDAVTISPVRNSFLIKVTFQSPWPDLNPEAANAIARTFIDVGRRQKEERTSRASVEFGRRRDEARKELESTEKKIADFRTTNQVADVQAEKENTDKLVADFEARYDQQQLDLVTQEKAHHEVEAARARGDLTQVAAVLQNATFQAIEKELRDAEAEKFRVIKEYTENHINVRLNKELIESLQARRETLIQSIVGQIETSFENARQAVDKIRELRDARRKEQQALSRLLIEQTNLEAERDRVRRDLDDLVRQASDVQGSTGFDLAPAVLHEEAHASTVPVKPKPFRDTLVTLFLAVLLGVGVAYLMEQFNDAVVRAEDVTRATGLPILGMLPRLTPKEGSPDIAAFHDPKSEMAEAVRIIRTGILFTPTGHVQRRRILVTSAEKGEGKTLLSTNLAAALAQTGQKTLLVDGDLRNPRIHKVFDLDNEKGLTHIFANGQIHPPTFPQKVGDHTLDVIPSGPMPPNPAELLGGERMADFLDDASKTYDRIVIDSPPAAPVSDPALLAGRCDGVILVVRLGSTSLRAIRRACDHLQKVDAPLLGVVLNGASLGGGYYYYYYYYRRYGYYGYYGYGAKKEEQESKA